MPPPSRYREVAISKVKNFTFRSKSYDHNLKFNIERSFRELFLLIFQTVFYITSGFFPMIVTTAIPICFWIALGYSLWNFPVWLAKFTGMLIIALVTFGILSWLVSMRGRKHSQDQHGSNLDNSKNCKFNSTQTISDAEGNNQRKNVNWLRGLANSVWQFVMNLGTLMKDRATGSERNWFYNFIILPAPYLFYISHKYYDYNYDRLTDNFLFNLYNKFLHFILIDPAIFIFDYVIRSQGSIAELYGQFHRSIENDPILRMIAIVSIFVFAVLFLIFGRRLSNSLNNSPGDNDDVALHESRHRKKIMYFVYALSIILLCCALYILFAIKWI